MLLLVDADAGSYDETEAYLKLMEKVQSIKSNVQPLIHNRRKEMAHINSEINQLCAQLTIEHPPANSALMELDTNSPAEWVALRNCLAAQESAAQNSWESIIEKSNLIKAANEKA